MDCNPWTSAWSRYMSAAVAVTFSACNRSFEI